MTAQARPPASPCVSICVIDEEKGYCTGCGRTLDEIAVWASASDAFRAEVWAALPERAVAMGLGVRRLDWQGERLLDEVEARFAAAAGTFVAGVYGAVAEVLRAPDEPFEVHRSGSVLTLSTPRAALRLEAARSDDRFRDRPPRTRPAHRPCRPGRTGRARRGPVSLPTSGRIPAGLLPRDPGGRRFDMGLGRSAARFTIRCDDDLAETLAPHCGTPWPDCLGKIGMAVLAASPVRVVTTPGLRAEVDAVIPPPGGTSPEGPHTHLLPGHIAQGFDTPPTEPLPEGYVLSALYYPN